MGKNYHRMTRHTTTLQWGNLGEKEFEEIQEIIKH
jgi:hypothetical protein